MMCCQHTFAFVEVYTVILHVSSLWVGSRGNSYCAYRREYSLATFSSTCGCLLLCGVACTRSGSVYFPYFSVLGVKSGQIFLMSIARHIIVSASVHPHTIGIEPVMHTISRSPVSRGHKVELLVWFLIFLPNRGIA